VLARVRILEKRRDMAPTPTAPPATPTTKEESGAAIIRPKANLQALTNGGEADNLQSLGWCWVVLGWSWGLVRGDGYGLGGVGCVERYP